MKLSKITTQSELTIYTAQFETVLLKFTASWCKPCAKLGETLMSLEQQFEEQGIMTVKLLEADVDDAEALASEYNISAVPTCIIFTKDKVPERLVGLVSKATLSQKLIEDQLNDNWDTHHK